MHYSYIIPAQHQRWISEHWRTLTRTILILGSQMVIARFVDWTDTSSTNTTERVKANDSSAAIRDTRGLLHLTHRPSPGAA
jgi:hypothetical protein